MVAQYKAWKDIVTAAAAPLLDFVNDERRAFGLPPIQHVVETHSDLATISQQPAVFDFPRQHLPDTFHYTGPFIDDAARPDIAFPWDKLDGRPIVYASLGTLQNNLPGVFRTIAAACARLDVQLVMGLGGGLDPERLGELPGKPLVLSYVPQRQILEHAVVMVTHAGMNSTLECLAAGVPMVAIPIAHDQPTIAQRIVWTRTGEIVSLADLGVETLESAIRSVLSDPVYRESARRFQEAIRTIDGLGHAAAIVEAAIETGKPVLRDSGTSATRPR
jgi:MGT family glycosyltransferase